jgi:hypothetical protein
VLQICDKYAEVLHDTVLIYVYWLAEVVLEIMQVGKQIINELLLMLVLQLLITGDFEIGLVQLLHQ